MRHKFLMGAAVLAAMASYTLAKPAFDMERALTVANLFKGGEQYEKFNRMSEIFPHVTVAAPKNASEFEVGEPIELPSGFSFRGRNYDAEEFLAETDTAALLVLQGGKIRSENYWLTGGRDVQWLSMSVAKSFTSALVGLAVEDGFIEDIEDPITKYVPSLKGSGYDGARIKDILQMSSGAAWNEEEGNPDSDLAKLGRIWALGGSFADFTTTIKPEHEPGTYFRYNSASTLVLGTLLDATLDRPIQQYMQEKLWQPLGMEENAYWLIDDDNLVMTHGGLNATARDYAKLGELYRKNGVWNGRQLIPSDWVQASTSPDAPHLMPGRDESPWGYGYQWWVINGNEGEYSAIGIFNQFIYVNPSKDLVIVKLSAYSDYAGGSSFGTPTLELETIELFREIGDSICTEAEC